MHAQPPHGNTCWFFKHRTNPASVVATPRAHHVTVYMRAAAAPTHVCSHVAPCQACMQPCHASVACSLALCDREHEVVPDLLRGPLPLGPPPGLRCIEPAWQGTRLPITAGAGLATSSWWLLCSYAVAAAVPAPCNRHRLPSKNSIGQSLLQGHRHTGSRLSYHPSPGRLPSWSAGRLWQLSTPLWPLPSPPVAMYVPSLRAERCLGLQYKPLTCICVLRLRACMHTTWLKRAWVRNLST